MKYDPCVPRSTRRDQRVYPGRERADAGTLVLHRSQDAAKELLAQEVP